MRVSQQPLQPGQAATVQDGHEVFVTPTEVVIKVSGLPLTATPIANLNAAIKPYGLRVQVYWRNKELGMDPSTGSICLFGKGITPMPLVPSGTVRVAIKTGATAVAGTVNTAPPAPVIAAPAPQPVVQTGFPSQPVSTAPAPVIAAPTPVAVNAPVVLVAPDDEPEAATFAQSETVSEDDEDLEQVSEADLQNSHRYRPNPDMLDIWDASEAGIAAGFLPTTVFFAGPAGSGKTDGAAFLAARAGLDFVKVDAASMTDPEAWFGFRDVVPDPTTGTSITVYTPSAMVNAVQRECVLFIDEVTRKSDAHRNVWLPMIDGTRRVMNPLTGQVLQVHPKCRIIMGGNIGLNFSGTYQVDIAFLTRVATITFDYLPEADEAEVLQEATGCDERTAKALARFGAEVRAMVNLMNAQGETDLNKVATRQLIGAAKDIRFGADIDRVANAYFFQMVSDEGGTGSLRGKLLNKWTGIRPLFDAPEDLADIDPADIN